MYVKGVVSWLLELSGWTASPSIWLPDLQQNRIMLLLIQTEQQNWSWAACGYKVVSFFGLQDGHTQEQPTFILANEKMTNLGIVRSGSGPLRLQ